MIRINYIGDSIEIGEGNLLDVLEVEMFLFNTDNIRIMYKGSKILARNFAQFVDSSSNPYPDAQSILDELGLYKLVALSYIQPDYSETDPTKKTFIRNKLTFGQAEFDQKADINYVNSLVGLGIQGRDPVELVNVIGNTPSPVTGNNLDGYILDTGANTGAWSSFSPGDLIQNQDGIWVLIKSLSVGDKLGCNFKDSSTPINAFSGKTHYLVEITGGTSGNFTYTFTAPSNGFITSVQNSNAYLFNFSFLYASNLSRWIQLSSGLSRSFNSSFTITGNVVSLNDTNAKLELGLDQVNNTSDINKPISNAVSVALSNKSSTGHNHNIEDLNNFSTYFGSIPSLDTRDTENRNRSNHTGTQPSTTITITATDSKLQYNNSGTFGSAENVGIEGGDLVISANSSPITPSANNLKLFAKLLGSSGSKVSLTVVDPTGLEHSLQSSLWDQKISRWNPAGNSATVPGVDGLPAMTTVGTATARSVATTNTLARAKRIGYVSATTTGAIAGHYLTAAQFTLGTGSNTGGFLYATRFGVSDAVIQTAPNTFIGLSSSVAAPTNVNPNTLINSIGLGHTSLDTNWFLYYGGSVAQTRINLGTSFPINTTNLMELILWSPADQNGIIYYRLKIVGTNTVTQGVLGPGTAGVTLPLNSTLLTHRAWRSNNTVAIAVGIDISSVYFETKW